MNIIELAKQVGAEYSSNPDEYDVLKITDGSLQAFAALVAAHEREACAKLCHDEADDGTEGLWDVCCFSLAKKIMARGEA